MIAVSIATSLDLATVTEGDTTYTVALYAGRLWVRDDSNEPVRADVLEAIESALRAHRKEAPMNRYRRARKLAGLTLGQGSRLLGIDVVRLSDIELARSPATEDVQLRMADVYGCSVEWLRGDHVEPPDELVKALRDADVSYHDRDIILEFAASIQGLPPKGSARERIAAVAARNAVDSTQEAADRSSDADQPLSQKRRYVRLQQQTRDHHCHWPGCDKQVPPAMWGCKPHWFRLPKTLRDRIWATYAPGQEVDMTPSNEYLQVADDVQRWIAAQR